MDPPPPQIKTQFILNACYVFLFCVLCAVQYVCFYTGHFSIRASDMYRKIRHI